MAIIQQPFLTNKLQWTHNLPQPSIFNPNQSFARIFLPSDKKKYRRRLVLHTGGAGVKSSFDYNNNDNGSNGYYEYEKGLMGTGSQYPRPTEVQWKKELCNSIQLIGYVTSPVQLKSLNSGKVLSSCYLAVKKSATDSFWINLTFWNELANVAYQHVEKGQQIYVSGRLISDTVDGNDGKPQTFYKVVVQQLNFVERISSSAASYDGDFNSNSIAPGRKQKNYTTNSTGSTEELWQAFFVNPGEWWDNRKDKRSPNSPDFKHKDTGEALWLNGRNNPTWVKSQLSALDAKMEAFQQQNANRQSDFMLGDNFTP